LSTSERERGSLRVLARRYLLIALSCLAFSIIYESFSHGVYSCFMMVLFLFPLLLGFVPFSLLARTEILPPAAARRDYHAGIAALGIGSCLSGILEIYGTTSPYICFYWIVGPALLLSGMIRFFLFLRRRRSSV
jgi:hypothetical protein